jgi:hypothetical protein
MKRRIIAIGIFTMIISQHSIAQSGIVEQLDSTRSVFVNRLVTQLSFTSEEATGIFYLRNDLFTQRDSVARIPGITDTELEKQFNMIDEDFKRRLLTLLGDQKYFQYRVFIRQRMAIRNTNGVVLTEE